MLSLLSVFIAAIAKAIADTIKHHPDTSIFKDKQFWIGDGKYFPFTKYKVDGWHLSNSLMIAAFLSLVFIEINFNPFLVFSILGVEFILIFNLFYNKIFRLKGWK